MKLPGKVYYWGTPLEKLVFHIETAMTCGDEYMAYKMSRELYRAFMRANPTFWEN